MAVRIRNPPSTTERDGDRDRRDQRGFVAAPQAGERFVEEVAKRPHWYSSRRPWRALVGVDQPPVIERDRPAADAADQLAIVGRDQHGRAPRVDFAQQIHDVEREIGIEVARRLVGKNQHRVVHQRARDRDALLLAARQLLRKRVHPVLQADPLQHLKRLPLLRRDRRAEHPRARMATFSSTVFRGISLKS